MTQRVGIATTDGAGRYAGIRPVPARCELLETGGRGMSKHTSGPWEIQTDGGSGDEHEIVARGWYIAQTFGSTPGGYADARLIAAAPDLLEALKAMVDAADADAKVLPGSGYYRIARAAIARAEG